MERRSHYTNQPIALAIMSLVEPLPCFALSLPSMLPFLPRISTSIYADEKVRLYQSNPIRSHSRHRCYHNLVCFQHSFHSFLASQPQLLSIHAFQREGPTSVWLGFDRLHGLAEVVWLRYFGIADIRPLCVFLTWTPGKEDCKKRASLAINLEFREHRD